MLNMNFEGDLLGYWGRNIIEDYHNVLLKKLPPVVAHLRGADTSQQTRLPKSGSITLGATPTELPRLPTGGYDDANSVGKVGILGAGVGGLYTALMLDSLDIQYEILEASDRTGGRLFTYKFPDSGEYDYYDVGAMRFPLPKKDDDGNYKTGVMKRLGELINYSKLNDSSVDVPLKEKLIDYYFDARAGQTFFYFNGEHYQVPASGEVELPEFHAHDMGVESEYVNAGFDNIVGDVVQPFARMIMNDVEKGTDSGWNVMKQNDAYSLRAYMSFKYIPSVNLELPPMHLDNNVINWCETFDKSTGWYDRGLTEEVLEALAFAKSGSQHYGEVEWKCFDGGSQVLSDYMAEYITTQGADFIQFGKSVTGISRVDDTGMNVTVRGESEPRTYSHVISTIPLPCLRTIDLSDAGLNVMQSTALRKLQYGPAIKIGIRFKSAWWTDKLGIVGGQSYTDLPIRTVVYPSYGVDSTPSTVLIASYCWTNDAERLGSLINTGETEYTDQLKELVLRNLAEVHGLGYNFLSEQYEDMHAWNWNHNPLTGGAFAFFGPGDFQDLYTSLTVSNANERLHFAGEAISTRHAWVVGALDSAWRAVYEYLTLSGQADLTDKFFDLWGKNIEWVEPSSKYVDGDFDPRENTLLRVHLGFEYAAELSGEVKF